jgi:nitroreductase
MSFKPPNPRSSEVEVDSMFTDRWSPRAFLPDPLPEHQIQALFEAARWAPSCFNEQPWFFLYATELKDREVFASILVKKNQSWAARAPLLMFAIARRKVLQCGKENRHAAFDTGAAWLSLALQARRMGLYAHAMAGFDIEKAHQVLGVPKEDFHVMAAIAVGRKGDEGQLSDDLRQIETPNARKPLSEMASQTYPLVTDGHASK